VPTLLEALAASVLGGGGMVVGGVLSETALPRMLDDGVLARAYGLVVPAAGRGGGPGRRVAPGSPLPGHRSIWVMST
jgi:hypothetical protein